MSFSELIADLTGDANAYKNRIEGKMLLVDNPALPHTEKLEKILQRNIKKKSKKFINRKEKKEIQRLDVSTVKYEDYLPLNGLWQQYIHELIGEDNKRSDQTYSRLVRADLHGCIMTGL